MSFSLDDYFRSSGTRFRVFAQSPVLDDFAEPETIYVSSPAGSLGPGPSDQRMYTLMPEGKQAYAGEDLPPWRGKSKRPILPGPDGSFDHVDVDDPAFAAVHMFGCVRRVLDVWEMYAGGPIQWHFSATHSRLELVPTVTWDNAQFGWGFMECGFGKDDQGADRPFSLNFDVLAHETGHGIVYSMLGVPTAETMTAAYRGFHESASDCVAMISALHFDSFIRHVLVASYGDLYLTNELNRIGELSKTRQIRSASNALKMSDVVSLDTPAMELKGKEAHNLGLPMTGAIFDILIAIFLERLVLNGAVSRSVAREVERAVEAGDQVRVEAVAEAYLAAPELFWDALRDARDIVGLRFCETLRRLSAHGLSYRDVARTFLAVDREISGSRFQDIVYECFAWREILPARAVAAGTEP